jgi:hypothetical protein
MNEASAGSLLSNGVLVFHTAAYPAAAVRDAAPESV